MLHSAIKLTISIALASMLVGCGFAVNQYGASVDNVTVMKSSGLKPVAIGTFSSFQPNLSTIGCRAAGSIEIPDNTSFESYIQKAFTDELKLAGLYDEKSTTKLQGKIEELDFNSNIGAGKWVLSLTLKNNTDTEYKTTAIHEFSTNWVADKACQQVAQAFVPAVQKLILLTVNNPKFGTLSKD